MMSVYPDLLSSSADMPNRLMRVPRLRVLMLLRRATFVYLCNTVIPRELEKAGSLPALQNDKERNEGVHKV
jgi:hypothetical protein